MEIKTVWSVYFSATGTTEKVVTTLAKTVAQELGAQYQTFSFNLPKSREDELTFGPDDLVVNVCKQKHVTNMRNASASEDSLRLVSVHPLTLEECLEFIDDDELLEITPKSLRMRKRVLSHEERARAAHRAKG